MPHGGGGSPCAPRAVPPRGVPERSVHAAAAAPHSAAVAIAAPQKPELTNVYGPADATTPGASGGADGGRGGDGSGGVDSVRVLLLRHLQTRTLKPPPSSPLAWRWQTTKFAGTLIEPHPAALACSR